MATLPLFQPQFPTANVNTQISKYDSLFGGKKAPCASLYAEADARFKDMDARLDVNELPAEKIRYRHLGNDDDALQAIGAFNGNISWNRQMVEYLDHMAPLEVFKFLKKFPEGAKTWENKKRKRSTYQPKKEPKTLCPIKEVKCCAKDCLQENLDEEHLNCTKGRIPQVHDEPGEKTVL
jgi:hypothetical protein